jgi:hypothetical protein
MFMEWWKQNGDLPAATAAFNEDDVSKHMLVAVLMGLKPVEDHRFHWASKNPLHAE